MQIMTDHEREEYKLANGLAVWVRCPTCGNEYLNDELCSVPGRPLWCECPVCEYRGEEDDFQWPTF